MRFAMHHTRIILLLAVAFTGCSLVGEDLRDCETDYHLDYELRLVTNMTTELETQLSMETEVSVSNALRTYLSGIFTDYARDVDLGFYDVEGDSTILHHEQHIMNANQSSYTLFIPVRKYMHLASANVIENSLLSIEKDDRCHETKITQIVRDTLPGHQAGVFTARLPMDIKEGEDQQFDVRLYMANCASALVVDTLGSSVRDIRVFMSGFATSFSLCDSLYHYDYTPIIKADELAVEEPSNGELAFVAAHFPSKPVVETKSVIDTDDSDVAETSDQTLWHYRVYATLADGTVTETLLGMRVPIKAGRLKLLKCRASSNGVVAPSDPTVAVIITMDWTPGLEIPVDL